MGLPTCRHLRAMRRTVRYGIVCMYVQDATTVRAPFRTRSSRHHIAPLAREQAEADRSHRQGFASRPDSLNILDSWELHIIAPNLSGFPRRRDVGAWAVPLVCFPAAACGKGPADLTSGIRNGEMPRRGTCGTAETLMPSRRGADSRTCSCLCTATASS
jgi:hypothetical protein